MGNMIRYLSTTWGLVFATVCSLWAAEPAPTGAVQESYRTTLEYTEGRYTSIFGLVPKEGKLALKEERVVVKESNPAQSLDFRLKLGASSVRRLLEVPGELPTIEVDPKPLTGKTIHCVQKDGKWDWSIEGVAAPTAAEQKEASRLAARFEPGRSPFLGVVGDPAANRKLDLERLLVFLGYAAPREVLGEAVLGVEVPGTPGLPVTLQTLFKTGEEKDELTVELEARGHLVSPDAKGGFRSFVLTGNLVVAGTRDLPDGRRVPFNIIAPFKYSVERSAMAAP